ncbi:TetR/AcrR family transcriptional regulator [Galactobacter valiniphilus]|uniref:TetR/AcrR family transcriptional regulator n=1 Tax=Galactobacter valiniphilus TaxID=2676122 RepID=UPI0037361C9A
MPRLTQAVQEQRRRHISEAAIRVFARRGVSATSMADIIEETGRSAGSVYSHFDSKNQLMCFAAKALMEARGDVLLNAVREWDEPVNPQQVLRMIVADVIPPELGGVLLNLLAESVAEPDLGRVFEASLAEWKSALVDLLAGWGRVAEPAERLRGVGQSGVLSRAADAILVAAHGILMRRALLPDTDIDTLVADSLVEWEAVPSSGE